MRLTNCLNNLKNVDQIKHEEYILNVYLFLIWFFNNIFNILICFI